MVTGPRRGLKAWVLGGIFCLEFVFFSVFFFLAGFWAGLDFLLMFLCCYPEFLEDGYVFCFEWIFSVTHGNAVNVTCLR